MSRFTIMFATSVIAMAPALVQAKELGGLYLGAGIGTALSGNTRADGVFTSTGTSLDGQRLGPEPGKTAKGNFDSSLSASLIAGYDLGERKYGRARLEAEIFNQQANTDKFEGELNGSELNPAGQVSTKISGFVVSAAYDVLQISSATIYGQIGLGKGNVDVEYDFLEQGGKAKISGGSEIIQAGFGVDMPYSEQLTIDFKYRFRRAGLNENGIDVDVDTHVLELGGRFTL